MCLIRSRPAWEEDVSFSNRPARHRHRVSETIIRERRDSSRAAQYVQAPPPPRVSTPIIRPASPPRFLPAPPSPPTPRIELVSVEEDRRSSPRTSRVSVSTGRGKHRRSSRAGEEVYIERERERVRMPPPEPPREEFDTYRYVPGPDRHESEDLRRSRSITYETNPRHSQRVIERERVVVEDGGRRREYYRRP